MSTHDETPFRATAESAAKFIRTTPLPTAPTSAESALEGALTPGTALASAKDQATVVGSDVISFVSGVSTQDRQDLINSALLAQLVAKVRVPDTQRIYDWYDAYFDVLKQIGWVVQSQQFAAYQSSSVGFASHEAILGVATTLLGGAPAALAVVKAKQSVEESRCDNRIAEDVAPFGKAAV